MRLAGKTAFCTASGAGIGLATARAFKAEGARVIATDINSKAVEALRDEGIDAHRLDVTDAAAITALAAYLTGVGLAQSWPSGDLAAPVTGSDPADLPAGTAAHPMA